MAHTLLAAHSRAGKMVNIWDSQSSHYLQQTSRGSTGDAYQKKEKRSVDREF